MAAVWPYRLNFELIAMPFQATFVLLLQSAPEPGGNAARGGPGISSIAAFKSCGEIEFYHPRLTYC